MTARISTGVSTVMSTGVIATSQPLATTAAQSSSASTQIAASNVTDEYLFLQVAWEITQNVATNTRDCLIRFGSLAQTTGSGLITSAFSAITPAGGGLVTDGGYYQRRRMMDGLCAMDEV